MVHVKGSYLMIYLGIDVSKNKLDLCLLPGNGKKKTKSMKNQPGAEREIYDWLLMQKCPPEQVTAVLEATSVYHENVAFGLHENTPVTVCMGNPQRVREFARGIGMLTKNDTADAWVLARYGELKQPDAWVPPSPEVRKLRELMRLRDSLQADVQRAVNRLEKAHSTRTSREVIDSLTRTRKANEEELKRIEALISDHTDNHPGLKEDRELLESIKGIGSVVGTTMLAVLHSCPFRSASQVASWLGVVPVEKTSGSYVRGLARMSKTGPADVRAKLYMAAVVASKWNGPARALYERLLAKGKAKKAALGAVMRKLVHQCFGVLKTRMKWDENYVATA
ncbi:IS110 family transposase [Pantoea cypripedii]